MKHNASITMRLPKEILDRAENLIPLMQDESELGSAANIKRSMILRMALNKGLEALEQKYGEEDAVSTG